MNEIKCPNCHKPFQIDEAGYANILKQVRDQQFEDEISQRLKLAEQQRVNDLALAETKLKTAYRDAMAKKSKKSSNYERLQPKNWQRRFPKKTKKSVS